MSTVEYVYAPPPPTPPPRDALISTDLARVSQSAPPPSPHGEPKAVQVRPYTRTKIPSERAHLMMSRFSWGYSRDLMAQMRHDGGPDAWFERQLKPTDIPDHVCDPFNRWYPDRNQSAKVKWDHVFNGRKDSWEYAVDLANWTLLRRTSSKRQLLEVMVDFWSNHLHVPSIHDTAWSWRNHYDGVLRRGALGKFDDLLVAASLHPAMLLFLSTDQSTKEHPDENQGRELLELHTVGVDAGYTEQMVKDSAKILTGYTVNTWRNWKGRYDPSIHWTGQVRVLGFESSNADPDGRAVTKAYLRYLARHPATARRLATKLGQRFVSDSPSDDLIDTVANAYLASGTSIRASLRALVAHPDFAASTGEKVRNPIEDFLATVRALGVKARRPLPKHDWPFAEAQIWMCKGQYPFMWPRPDGLPLGNEAWSSASQVLGSLDTHYSLAGGWVGDKGSAHYHTYEWWLPQPQIRFDAFVDHLCRMLLGRESTPRLLRASCQATGVDPAEKVNQRHELVQWLMPRLLTAILDTAEHLTR
jgi:uncharacterized protein (DUF1800 family)